MAGRTFARKGKGEVILKNTVPGEIGEPETDPGLKDPKAGWQGADDSFNPKKPGGRGAKF